MVMIPDAVGLPITAGMPHRGTQRTFCGFGPGRVHSRLLTGCISEIMVLCFGNSNGVGGCGLDYAPALLHDMLSINYSPGDP